MTRSKIFKLLSAGSAGLIVLLAAGWLQNVHPAFDSLSHFRLHFSAALFCLLPILIMLRYWILGGAGIIAIALSLFLTAPYLPNFATMSSQASGSGQQPIIRLVQMNLRFNNKTPQRAADAIRLGDPDILLLQEVTEKTVVVLDAFLPTHPHQLACHRFGVGSVAIASRFPFADQESKYCAPTFGFASAQLRMGEQVLHVASFHSLWPWPFRQARQINYLSEHFKALRHPLVLAGDFNASPWSAAVQSVAEKSRTRVAKGMLMSWAPRQLAVKEWLGPILPIDQVMTSPRFKILSRTRLGDGGSDHFPILTQLQLSP